MIPTSQQYKDYANEYRLFDVYLSLVDENGDPIYYETEDPEDEGIIIEEEIEWDASHIKENTLRFTDEICNPGSFGVGSTISNKFECTLIDHYPEIQKYKDNYVRMTFSVPFSIACFYELFNRGFYKLNVSRESDGSARIEGYDRMSLDYYNTAMTGTYGTSTTTTSQALQLMGFDTTNMVYPDVVVGQFSFTDSFGLKNATRRDVLGYICQICGSYARFNNDGELEMKFLNITSGASGADYTVDQLVGLPSYDPVGHYIVGVIVTAMDGSVAKNEIADYPGTNGYYITIEDNPFIKTTAQAQEVADRLFNKYKSQTFYSVSLNTIGDPSWEAGDVVTFETDGNTVTTIITNIDYAYNSSCTLSTTESANNSTEELYIANKSGQYGFNSGDVYSSTFYGYGYTPSGSGYAYIEIPLTKPINASAVTITAGTNMAVRGTTGLMKSGSLADFTIVNTSINAGGFRIQMSGLTTHFTAQTPVSFVGNLTLSFS